MYSAVLLIALLLLVLTSVVDIKVNATLMLRSLFSSFSDKTINDIS